MDLLLILELALLVLFIVLGLRLLGKVLGLILALVSWLIVGGLLFGIFLYPDYQNFKDPTVKVHIDKINDKTVELILSQAGVKVDLPDVPGINLDEATKNKLIKKYLENEYLNRDITVRNGTSPGTIIIDLSFIADHQELLDNKTSNFEKLKIILKGYEEGHVRTEPPLKNKELVDLIAKYIAS